MPDLSISGARAIPLLGIGGRVVRDVRSGFRQQAYFAVIEADRARGHDVRAQQSGLVVRVSRPHSKAFEGALDLRYRLVEMGVNAGPELVGKVVGAAK